MGLLSISFFAFECHCYQKGLFRLARKQSITIKFCYKIQNNIDRFCCNVISLMICKNILFLSIGKTITTQRPPDKHFGRKVVNHLYHHIPVFVWAKENCVCVCVYKFSLEIIGCANQMLCVVQTQSTSFPICLRM